jgi:arabinogalactan endo-1,4-beta-galactosidase
MKTTQSMLIICLAVSLFPACAKKTSSLSDNGSQKARRAAQATLKAYADESPAEHFPEGQAQLENLEMPDAINVNYAVYFPIAYSVSPSELQDAVKVTYAVLTGGDGLLVFDSDHPDHPNTVRAINNAAGSYTVAARANAYGTAKITAFTVRVEEVEAMESLKIAPDTVTVFAGIAPVPFNYIITPSSLKNRAALTFSDSPGLVFEGGTVTAARDTVSGPRSITAAALLDSDPLHPVVCQFIVNVIGEDGTTKNGSNRGGETLAELASQFDDSALNDAYYVQPADNLENFSKEYVDNFILGIDVSTLIEVENAGGKYYDADGYETGDALELLSWYGVNWIRARLWHNPYHSVTGEPYGGGTCDIDKAIALSRRAKKWGMKFLLDFHYSDFWAHPGQQSRPRAWPRNAGADAVAKTLKKYTKDALKAMAKAGALPDMVQIGNETNTGIAGFSSNADTDKLYAAGLAAVREISKQYKYPIKTMLHATNGISQVMSFFDARKGLDFDVLGMSYYPMWHGSRSSFRNGLGQLTRAFNKEICVVEYSAAYTVHGGAPYGEDHYESNADTRSFLGADVNDRTIRAQAQLVRNLNSDIMNFAVSGNGERLGIGSFWWEGAWLPLKGIAWAMPPSNEWYRMGLPGSSGQDLDMPGAAPKVSWANQGFFSFKGTVMPSANAFLQLNGREPRTYTKN